MPRPSGVSPAEYAAAVRARQITIEGRAAEDAHAASNSPAVAPVEAGDQVWSKRGSAATGWGVEQSGGSSPYNWCRARITLGADLTVASAFYDFQESDFTIVSQSGSDFSLGTDPDQADGAIISASGGQFSAAVMLGGGPGAATIVLDPASTAPRYLQIGAVGGGANPLNGMGIDGFVPVLNEDGSFICTQMCVSTDLIVQPGESVFTGVTLGFGNTVGSDSFGAGKTFNVAVWQTGTIPA